MVNIISFKPMDQKAERTHIHNFEPTLLVEVDQGCCANKDPANG